MWTRGSSSGVRTRPSTTYGSAPRLEPLKQRADEASLADAPILLVDAERRRDLGAEPLRRVCEPQRSAEREQRPGHDGVQQELLELAEQRRVDDEHAATLERAENVRQQGLVGQPDFGVESGDEPRVAMRQEPEPALDGRDRSGQVLRVAFTLAAEVSGEEPSNPALAVLREELAREGDLLLGEVDEACEVVWDDVGPREPNARLERSFERIAGSQVVERRHQVVPLGVRVAANDAANAVGAAGVRVPRAELVVRVDREDGRARASRRASRDGPVVLEDACEQDHHQVALAAPGSPEHAEMMRERRDREVDRDGQERPLTGEQVSDRKSTVSELAAKQLAHGGA